MNASNVSLKLTFPDGTSRKVEPYEVPYINDTLALAVVRLKQQKQDLLEALEAIAALEDSERDEWDGVERVIPEMAAIARAAIAKATDA